jgi:hypothetical protein
MGLYVCEYGAGVLTRFSSANWWFFAIISIAEALSIYLMIVISKGAAGAAGSI